MTPTYYEIIVELPSDIEVQLPNISDSFVNWLNNKVWTLPEDADWDMDQVDTAQLTLGDKIQRELLKHWRCITKNDEAFYYVQLEQGESYFHLHCLIECCSIKPMVLGRYVNQIEKKIVATVFGGHRPLIENWMRITKTKNIGGSNKVRNQSYIPAYLIPKTQPEAQWAWTNIPEYVKACLNARLRHSLAEAHLEEVGLPPTQDQLARNASGAPVIASRCSKRYMELVDWLVEKGITTEKQWLIENKESYRSFQSTSNSARQIKTALQSAIQEMLLTKSAEDYLITKDPIVDITENKIYKILEMNGYDPLYAGTIFVGWCRKRFGKRNTLWLFGPATTGKTNIAEAIAHAVPFYGCVNWTNENFPFNDCVDKMVIWWEEGKMTSKVVETAKAILGGSKVRVDQKCKSSVALDPTPVIITSNTNMCYVIDGNSTTFEHAQPLQDRMFKFELLKRLPDDFGKVTKREVREFFRWAAENPVDVTSEFMVRKGRHLKRPAPRDEAEVIKEGPPAKRSVERPMPAGEEPSTSSVSGLDFHQRYKMRCSKHLGWDVMKFSCKDCEKANQAVNQCLLHKTLGCKECYPDYTSSSDEELPSFQQRLSSGEDGSDKENDCYVPCAIHHLMGKAHGLDNCAACRLKNSTLHMSMDDCDDEQ